MPSKEQIHETIDYVIARKRQSDEQIAEIIRKLEADTGLRVTTINYNGYMISSNVNISLDILDACNDEVIVIGHTEASGG